MATPIFDKKKQLQYIKGRLHLISYMVEQLSLHPEEAEADDFAGIELELKKLMKKTNIFHYRHQKNQK